jgi:DNA-directed RNA polymerase specialized sigma24 family protein
MTDLEYLRQYAATGSHDAFAHVVRQHVDMVFTAARRQTGGDDDLAEEVTQRVFIALAQKAGR